ncbi:HNH endonuclease [Synechocystis sp. PCC 7339]|uniref:HNH endonuclease signature motif containing protein n=1 Tax=unclassified Synechocystis TaxID=2640012 RepID=UPI001BB02CF4|nr:MULTISPECIES: HNH endonuclease signature motif containing protein [unclassified Synechocystis]QUS59394.1 HNH endonuclease [Synechocystis sp. PCC 7338]UAJ71577.1 HNH endonuclease [Synechocystis sp. PCC 7339]
MKKNSFLELFCQYKIAQDKVEGSLKNLDDKVERIKKYYSPRNQFNRWRDSGDGKNWKKRQHEKQKHKCANPNCNFVYEKSEYFDIDHIKPIKTHPHLAVDKKNLQLLCPPCNSRKGALER